MKTWKKSQQEEIDALKKIVSKLMEKSGNDHPKTTT
jgi:hypothetical protein